MELFEVLANRLGAERVMKDYVEFVDVHSNDVGSMFHAYALNHYAGVQGIDTTGITCETADRVLHEVKEEMERRKSLADGESG
jgi:hypothetical protein